MVQYGMSFKAEASDRKFIYSIFLVAYLLLFFFLIPRYAAVGFSQYLSLNPDVVKGKKILELGAGLGLPGIVASHLGAKSVTLSEFGYDGEVDGPIIEKSDEKRLVCCGF